ncbi:MAG: DUF6198 family protein [Clostridia bacterium]|nr:DUF6198 family protein [Clostridia bacterium]
METKKKFRFYSEAAYPVALVLIAFGVAFMERADFGVSMIVAPAYVIFRKVSLVLPWFTFGTAEYLLQATLLLLMWAILRKFRLADCLSFVTAFVYGMILDACMALMRAAAPDPLYIKVILYIAGMVVGSLGVALMFRTYMAPEVYELFVKKISRKAGVEIHRFKTGYDLVSLSVGVVLSFALFGFGRFIGVRWGTIVCALVNGAIISVCSKALDRVFAFEDRFAFRPFFEDV